MSIDAEEEEYLYVAPSGIPGAGLGLFTAIPVHRGEVVAVYTGEVLTAAEARRRAADCRDAYFVTLLDGSTLDSASHTCLAKYANDADGPGRTRLRNNAVITLDDEDRPCIMALRTIPAGREVLVSYGPAYWSRRSALSGRPTPAATRPGRSRSAGRRSH